jgi:hypothetical protein
MENSPPEIHTMSVAAFHALFEAITASPQLQ